MSVMRAQKLANKHIKADAKYTARGYILSDAQIPCERDPQGDN
jgi:hypothetical protein